MAKITPQQVQEISRLIALCNTWVFNGDEVRMIKEAIRHQFNIHALEDLDQDLFYDVLDFAERVQMQIMKATVIINDFKQHAFKQCIMGGAPLTTAIAKKYRQQLDALPPVINWAQMMQALETAKAAGKKAVEVSHV
ncbi:MAG: hypothetical protein M1579_01505 [Gammaproteobacteria bacterium]|nr:hypothetical protein [Gammaproteobacteria bacterium]